jgi:hypothetical protein
VNDQPRAVLLAVKHRPAFADFHTGQVVRLYCVTGGVETRLTGVVTVEAGSVRLGDGPHWIDWDSVEYMEILETLPSRKY